MLKVACLIIVINSVSCFLTSKSLLKVNHLSQCRSTITGTQILCMADDEDDPYGELLDLQRPIEVEESAEMVNVWSIDSSIDQGSLAKTRMTPKTAQEQWEHWDAFMEQEFGNMDAEITEDQKWMIDMRDMVEQKRGFAIWSKKSEKELQRELKKALEKKALNVPDSVAMIIRAVYLEKTHTMKKMKKDQELACIGFRKWVIEQKKKTKKDPLPLARIEVSKKWIDMHPNTSMGYSSNKSKAPPVVMDDCTIPVYGVAFGSSKGSGTASATLSNTIVTASMLNWEKKKDEIPQKEAQILKPKVVKVNDEAYFIDEEEMFIASRSTASSMVEEDYFVVL